MEGGEGHSRDNRARISSCVPALEGYAALFPVAPGHAQSAKLSSVEPQLRREVMERRRVGDATRRFLMSRLTLENLSLAIILLGIVLRVESYLDGEVGADGALYTYAAGCWLQLGRPSFLWAEPRPPLTFGSLPLLHVISFVPSFLGGGVTQESAKLSVLVLSLVGLAVTFWTTNDLVGRLGGLVMTALFASLPVLISAVGTGYGENTFLLFLALTVWSFLRAVRDHRLFAVFAVSAGALLLTKQEVTPYLVFGGIVAFYFWQLRTHGWTMFRMWGTLSVGPVLAFEAYVRNLASGRSTEGPFSLSLALTSASFWQLSIAKLLLVIGISAMVGLFLGKELYWELRNFKKPESFPYFLILAVLLSVAWLESSIRIFNEPYNSVYSRDDQRYVFVSFMPLILIAITRASRDGKADRAAAGAARPFDFSSRSVLVFFSAVAAVAVVAAFVGAWLAAPLAIGSIATLLVPFRHRVALLLLTFALLGANSATSTIHYSIVDAVHTLDCLTISGDAIALDTPNRSITMADVYIHTRNRAVVLTRYNGSSATEFVLSDGLGDYPGFRLVARFNSSVERTGLARVVAWLVGEPTQSSADPITSIWISEVLSGRTPSC